MTEAQEAYVRVNAQEGEARNAYRQAISSRSRQAYQTFLASYGASTYAADVHQRLASCHNEVRNSGSTQTSELRESATATSSDPNTACNEARVNAAGHAQQECTAQQGRPGGVRVLSQRTGNAASSPDMGRVAGQVLGSTLFGNRNYNNYNTPAQYQCVAEIAASCLRTSNSARSVEICQ